MWRSGATAGAVARALMGPVLGGGAAPVLSACGEPAGNGVGQSICSAPVGSGGSVTLYGGRPLRSRHRIGKPTVLHAARVHGSVAGATTAPRTGRPSPPPWHSC